MVGVSDLEKLARESQNGKLLTENGSVYHSGLNEKEEFMGLSLTYRRDRIRQLYPAGSIIAAELGCHVSTVVGDMNEVEGVEAFGIDLHPILDTSQKLPPERLIAADLNNMPQIPDESFHYILSFNCLVYTKPEKSFPEIYRVLKRGGIADLDLEWWIMDHAKTMSSLSIVDKLVVRGVLTRIKGDMIEFSSVNLGTVPEFLESYANKMKTDRDFAHMVNRGTYFFMQKPF